MLRGFELKLAKAPLTVAGAGISPVVLLVSNAGTGVGRWERSAAPDTMKQCMADPEQVAQLGLQANKVLFEG